LSLEKRARFYARQGHAFATADEARVVEQDENLTELRDVPWDGKTVGEIVTRGNIVMKQVSLHHTLLFLGCYPSSSTSAILKLRRRRSVEEVSIQEIWL
jgi:hypothetical protein